ncbi:MAG: hypothetical protein ACJ75G_00045 [Gaiellaceae bacterium]
MRTSLVLTIALGASLAFPSFAGAKGPASATMSGPGISGIRHLTGDSEAGPGSPLGALTMTGGFFPQVFAGVPDPTRSTRPQGNLGPRYSVTYVMPGPNGDSLLRQDFYPYARPAPLTYMKPGQTFWGGQRTHGGWFTVESSLPRKLGLPAQPPTSGGTDIWRWSGLGGGALVLAAAIGLLIFRLRPRAKPVSA